MGRRAAILPATPAAVLALGWVVVSFASGGFGPVPRQDALLVAALVAGATVLTAPIRLSRPAAVALGGLAGFAAWTAISTAWAPLAGPAQDAVERALLYLAALAAGTLAWQARSRARAVEPLLLAGIVAVVGEGMAGRLLPGIVHLHASISAAGRLEQPLTYWNAVGAMAGMGLVLACRLGGDSTRPAPLRSAAVATSPLLAAALVLTFSRGALVATAGGVLALLVLAPTWTQLRAAAICVETGAIGAGAALALGAVRTASGPVGHRELQGALVLLVLLGAAALAVGVLAWERHDAWAGRLRDGPIALPRGAGAGVAVVCVLLLLVPILAGRRETGAPLARGATTARLTSAQSNRYEYWRVGLEAWADKPLQGTGAGGFRARWLQHRRFPEGVEQAHSLEVQTLCDLGLVGAALLAALLAGVALAARRAWRTDPGLASGAIAVCTVWLLHASIDWDWELPALTLAATLPAGMLLARSGAAALSRGKRPAPAGPPRERVATAAATPPRDEVAPAPPAAAVSPPALAPPPGNPRFPLFDGLRGIAAISIVLVHAALLTTFTPQNTVLGPLLARLDVGVAVFFVISGFLLWRPFVAARLDGRPPPGTGRFLWRRALRILPAMWVALVVLSAWPGLAGIPGHDAWRCFLLIQNWHRIDLAIGIGPTWTLAIEAQFYVLLPFAARAAARAFSGWDRRRQVRAELSVIAGLGVASVAARTLLYHVQPHGTFGYTVLGTFGWFAPGMAYAVLSAAWHGPDALPRPAWARWLSARTWLLWLGAAVVLVLSTRVGLSRDLHFRYTEAQWLYEHLFYLAFAALFVLPAVLTPEARTGPVGRVLGNPLAAWLGLVSYGVYLYHLPIMPKLLGAQSWDSLPFATYVAVSLAVALACGAASYYVVERPLLSLKDRRVPGWLAARLGADDDPASLRPAPGEPRFRALDGLRAVAALSVVVFHAAATSGFTATRALGHLSARLDVGVTVFFALSGFLLYRPFVAARYAQRAGPPVGRFYRRRLLRIVPAYWAALTLLSIWPGLSGDPLSRHWWRYFLFLQNTSPATLNAGIVPAWTLCVEMSFYLLLPLYALVLARGLGRRSVTAQLRAELGLLGLLSAASLAWRAVASGGGATATLSLHWLPALMLWFAVGMAAAALSAADRLRAPSAAACWTAAVGVMLLLGFGLGLRRALFQYQTATGDLEIQLGDAAVAVLLLWPAVAGGGPAALRGRLLVWLGGVSYGIYLYHLPIIVQLAPAGATRMALEGGGAAVLCAAASFYGLERPLLRLKDAAPGAGRRGSTRALAPRRTARARDAIRD